MAFEVYREQLKTVPSFKYLERILTAGDYEGTEELGTTAADTKQGEGKQESVGELL